MASTLSNSNVFETNPYEGHPNLSELEAEVLWEYARLAQNVKEVSLHAHTVSFPLCETFSRAAISHRVFYIGRGRNASAERGA
jgi:hypothetical protein